MDRRQFIKTAVAAVAAVATPSPVEKPTLMQHVEEKAKKHGMIYGTGLVMLNRDMEPIPMSEELKQQFKQAYERSVRGINQADE